MTSAASVFEQLIAPHAPQDFLDEYWERRPVYIPGQRDAAAKVDLLGFDLAALKRAARRITTRAERPQNGLPALTTFDADRFGSRYEYIRGDQIDSSYAAGSSISLTGLQFLDARLAMIAARLRRELAGLGAVHMQAFLSPDRHGAAMHFDQSSVMSVQIEGTKRWRFSRTRAMEAPPEIMFHKGQANYQRAYPWARITAPDAALMDECVLLPGDVLYLPAGTWHEVAAAGHSLAITIIFEGPPLHALVTRRLEQLLIERSGWRPAPRPLLADGGEASGLERLVETFAQRLGELRALVAALAPEELAAWAYPDHLSIETEGETEAEPADGEAPADLALNPDDVLVAPHPLRWSPASDALGGHVLIVSSPYASASLGVDALPLAEKLVGTPSFRAVEAMGWSFEPDGFSWEEVRDALAGLIAQGLLRRRAPVQAGLVSASGIARQI